PLLAVLTATGTIPKWTDAVFAMKNLTATIDAGGSHGVLDLALAAHSEAVEVTGRIHGPVTALGGALLVQTTVGSAGVELDRGESHVSVFAGEDWLRARMAAIAAQARREGY